MLKIGTTSRTGFPGARRWVTVDDFDHLNMVAYPLLGADWTPHGVLGLVELAASTHLKCQHIIATFSEMLSSEYLRHELIQTLMRAPR